MTDGRAALLAVCAVASLCVATPTASSQEPCDERSWVGGTTEWCDGTLVYRDYVYDDAGADTTGMPSVHGTPLNRTSGDVDHRDHGQALNSADLLTLRLRRDGSTLHARFELNTLFDGDATVAALAIDADDDPATGGGPWGVVDVSSAGWETVALLNDRDASANVIEGALPVPDTSAWRVQAVVALGDGTPMNVAFRPQESGNWWEDRQADAFAAGNISAFGHRVTAAELGVTHAPAPPAGPGLHERVYTSDYPIAEGVNYGGRTLPGARGTYHYLGRHQPYGLYIPPPDGSGTYGLQFALHGASANHASLVNFDGMQHAFGDYLRSLGDKPRLIVVPLGRGPNGGYVDYSERDVLDVLADVQIHFPVDADRIFTGGYSMGGAGTYWLSSLHPDRFAAGINWVGYTSDCLNGTPLAQGRQRPDPPVPGLWTNEPGSGCEGGQGNVFDYLEGTRHVPMAMWYAGADELVWANHAVALMRRYDALDYEHVMWFHPVAEHFTPALFDDWKKEARWSVGRTRVARPAHVSYRTNPYLWFEEADLRHDGAYWVDELEPASPNRDRLGDISVELVSHRCAPHAEYTADLSNGAGTDPVPWISQEGKPRTLAPIEQADRISGTVTNAASLLIDVEGACLGPGEIELDVEVDGPTVVRFSDGRPDRVLTP